MDEPAKKGEGDDEDGEDALWDCRLLPVVGSGGRVREGEAVALDLCTVPALVCRVGSGWILIGSDEGEVSAL